MNRLIIMIAIIQEMEKNPTPESKRVPVPKMLVLKSISLHFFCFLSRNDDIVFIFCEEFI